MSESYSDLERIATESLQACYVDGKIVASPTHFSDFWARDTFWALPGMLVSGDVARAKECIAYFLSLQRADGKVPRKVSRDINVLKYLFGKSIPRKKPRPTYHGLVKPFHAMDSGLLLIIAMEEYLSVTRDYDFAEKSYAGLQRAIGWHMDRAQGSLISEYFLGNWMDTVFKFGPVLYTNVLYARALESMVMIAQIAGRDDDAELYAARAMSARRAVREKFWGESFFVDEIRIAQRGTFDLAGNVLAVLYGIANDDQTGKILTHVTRAYDERGICMAAVPTGHAWWKINPIVRCMGIADYHTRTSWLWIDALVMEVLHKNGSHDIAQDGLQAMQKIALRDGEIGETYGSDGEPYVRQLWRSASPFAWSSGIILAVLSRCEYTAHTVQHKKQERRHC